MSDKIQHTALALKDKMLKRYGDELHHKHNKYHLRYRQHSKTHPCTTVREYPLTQMSGPTGLIKQSNLRKTRKRVNNGNIH